MTWRRARPERGQATVELALLLPVLVLLLLTILQVALLGRDVVLVTHASREAARAAAVDPDPGAARAAARAAAGLDDDRLDVSVSGRARGDRVRVTVTYRAPTTVPIVGALLGDPTFQSSATMRVEPSWPRARVDLRTLPAGRRWAQSGHKRTQAHKVSRFQRSRGRNPTSRGEREPPLDVGTTVRTRQPIGAHRSSSDH